MTTINKNIIDKAAISISSFIKNIDKNTPADDHQILLVDGVPVAVETKVKDDLYTATAKVAGYSVFKTTGFKNPADYSLELNARPGPEELSIKIAKVMLDNAGHDNDTYYDFLCAINDAETKSFTATFPTGHVIVINDGMCHVNDLSGNKLKDIKLGDFSAFGSAVLQIKNVIAGNMTVASFTPFELKDQ